MRLIAPAEPLPEGPKRGCRGCLITIGVAAALLLGLWYFNPWNRFPTAALDALANDSGAVFYSIEPESQFEDNEDKETFHGYVVLGKTILADRADRDAMVHAIATAAYGAWDEFACFNPRHGFRATTAEGTYDFLLCFACGAAYTYLPDGSRHKVLILGTGDSFNRLLSKNGIQLAKKQ